VVSVNFEILFDLFELETIVQISILSHLGSSLSTLAWSNLSIYSYWLKRCGAVFDKVVQETHFSNGFIYFILFIY
jgi:hypothetical protein